MKLIVGLGNPGNKFSQHRHNVGYMAVEGIADTQEFSPWKSKFQGLICEGRLGTEKSILLKPETFMNLSGQSVGQAMRFFKLSPDQVIVFHDELDLAPGKVRVKAGGGHAGHNGLRSLHQHIGPDYVRVRIGIGHPGHKDRVSGYVLHDFAKSDQNWLDAVLAGINDGAADLAMDRPAEFMNAIGLQVKPPRSSEKPKSANPPHAVAAPAEMQIDRRNPLQKLADKFR